MGQRERFSGHVRVERRGGEKRENLFTYEESDWNERMHGNWKERVLRTGFDRSGSTKWGGKASRGGLGLDCQITDPVFGRKYAQGDQLSQLLGKLIRGKIRRRSGLKTPQKRGSFLRGIEKNFC